MSKFLISFPASALNVPEDEFQDVVDASHSVVREAKDAGVWVFGGGIDDTIPPILVEADGAIARGTYPETVNLAGGYTIIDVPSYEEATRWAVKLAKVCRCPQELRVFHDDPEP